MKQLKPHEIEALAWLQARIDPETFTIFTELWDGRAYLKGIRPPESEGQIPSPQPALNPDL